jgi:L-fuconolactonase
MLIADSQVHLWAADTPERPWPPGRAAQAQKPYPVTKEALLLQMDLAGVHRIVLVPPSWEGDRNDLALEAAARYPDRFAVMGRLALEKPESRALVADWKKQPGMLGMRFTFHTDLQRPWLTDGTADWLWPAAERAGIPLMVLRRIATGAGVFEDLPKVCGLARYPNVAVKASGVPSLSAEPYPFRDVHEPMRRLFDAYGPARMFWGTDLTRMPCSYRECIDLFTREMSWLRGDDLAGVMGRGVCEWLGWPIA